MPFFYAAVPSYGDRYNLQQLEGDYKFEEWKKLTVQKALAKDI